MIMSYFQFMGYIPTCVGCRPKAIICVAGGSSATGVDCFSTMIYKCWNVHIYISLIKGAYMDMYLCVYVYFENIFLCIRIYIYVYIYIIIHPQHGKPYQWLLRGQA